MYQSNTCNMTYNEHWCLILSTFLAHTLTPLCIRTLHKLVQLIRNTNNRVQRNAFLPVLLIPMPPYQYQLKIHYHMLEYTKHRTQKHTHISHTFTLRVLTGSLSRDTVRGKMTSSLKTTGSSTGDWKNKVKHFKGIHGTCAFSNTTYARLNLFTHSHNFQYFCGQKFTAFHKYFTKVKT